ncbi:diguanylate cyclase [Paracoccaceae bacterium Fryx2]|nr:diguanylate cyclase [Paracoccaceae bacterium Fryx2]
MPNTAWMPTRAMRALVEAVNDAILITTVPETDPNGPSIVYANPAFCRIAGYRQDELIGKSPRIMQGPGTDQNALRRIRHALDRRQGCREEVLNYSRDGTPYWLDMHIVPLFDDDGQLQYFGAIQRDVTEARHTVDRLKRLAHEDVLTGLGNRAALHHRLETLWESGAGTDTPIWFLLFDMDGFKAINDTLGHLAGDNILRTFAAHVVSALQPDDFVTRLGGDEFAVILKGYTRRQATDFAEQVIASLSTMPVSGSDRIGVSAGMTALWQSDTFETVFSRADAALYKAKSSGRGVLRLHSGPWAPQGGQKHSSML